jgi:putative spermidine/putrescine transport system ATP-binding protein
VAALDRAGDGGIARTAEGLTLRTRAPRDGAAVICIRPESIILAAGEQRDPAGAAENRFAGRISEAVFTAGSVRYKVALPEGTVLTLRQPSRHGIPLQGPGETVTIAWRASDTLLIDEA